VTEERSLVGPAIVLTPISITILVYTVSRLETEPPWLLMASFAALAVWVDDWPHWVGRKMAWSNSSPLVIAAIVLAPASTAPLVGAVILMPTAVFASERSDFRPSRFATNLSHLAIDGFALGLVLESLRASTAGPTFSLLGATVVAYLVSVAISICGVGLISVHRMGTRTIADLSTIARVMPVREAPAVIGSALLASATQIAGPGWGLLLVAHLGALVSFPLIRAQMESKRTWLITNVTDALDGDGLVSGPYARLERLALSAGRHLGMTGDQLQQLRYVSLSYSMTEVFANELARPLDFPEDLRAQAVDFSRVLFYGLALADVADRRVQVLGDAAARLDALLFPEPGDPAFELDSALSELTASGVEADITCALKAGAKDETYGEWREHISRGFLYAPRSRRRDR
jgi:hypothetical protein